MNTHKAHYGMHSRNFQLTVTNLHCGEFLPKACHNFCYGDTYIHNTRTTRDIRGTRGFRPEVGLGVAVVCGTVARGAVLVLNTPISMVFITQARPLDDCNIDHAHYKYIDRLFLCKLINVSENSVKVGYNGQFPNCQS